MQVTNKNLIITEKDNIKDKTEKFNNKEPLDSLYLNTGFSADSCKITGLASKPLPNISLVPKDNTPVWSNKIKQKILASYDTGLRKNNITEEEINSVIKEFNLSDIVITRENAQNPAFSADVKGIQEKLNTLLNNSELAKLGIKNKIPVDGQFGGTTVQALITLRDTQRGEPVSFDVPSLLINPKRLPTLITEILFSNG